MTTQLRRRGFVLIAGVVVAVAAVLAIVLPSSSHTPSVPPPSRTGTGSPAAIARLHAVQAVVRARSAAIVERNRSAFMATLDPQAKKFRRGQSQLFAHLAPVPIASWTYGMTATPRREPPNAGKYDAPTWAPSYFALHYRLAGFDTRPTSLQQFPTFVDRNGHWYLASLTDYAPRGHVSATDLWDYGPVSVLRRKRVLVLGAPSQRATMTEVARDVQAAIGQVDAVWGTGWARRAVVLVPATMREMALIDDYRGDLHNLAALTSAEVSGSRGGPAPVGDRITINPANWPLLSDIGANVVIRHELTHVATRQVTGRQTPTWLSEGFADYVGFRPVHVSVDVAAAALKRRVIAGGVPSELPANPAFRSSNAQLAMHYEEAWLACRYIAQRFGEQQLVRFYRAVGTSSHGSRGALAEALQSVLHLRLNELVAGWRHYVAAELG